VVTSETSEATALGATICAAVGGGLYKSIKEATKEMVRGKKNTNPDINKVECMMRYSMNATLKSIRE